MTAYVQSSSTSGGSLMQFRRHTAFVFPVLLAFLLLVVRPPGAEGFRHGGAHHGGHAGHHGGHGGHHGGHHGGVHHHGWGGWWHPIGFLVTTLAVTAIVVSVSSHDYHYDQGVYYEKVDDGYKVVPAPVGAQVDELPENSVEVKVGSDTFYYYGGAFYHPDNGKYKVVQPPVGAVVSSLPDGTNTIVVGDKTYFQYGNTYYQAQSKDGNVTYAVVAKPS